MNAAERSASTAADALQSVEPLASVRLTLIAVVLIALTMAGQTTSSADDTVLPSTCAANPDEGKCWLKADINSYIMLLYDKSTIAQQRTCIYFPFISALEEEIKKNTPPQRGITHFSYNGGELESWAKLAAMHYQEALAYDACSTILKSDSATSYAMKLQAISLLNAAEAEARDAASTTYFKASRKKFFDYTESVLESPESTSSLKEYSYVERHIACSAMSPNWGKWLPDYGRSLTWSEFNAECANYVDSNDANGNR